MREHILRVTIKDCEVQTFRAGGKGGQNQNKRDTGVRIIHHPSGARGECREERSQLANKRRAFEKMSRDPRFRVWVNLAVQSQPPDEPSKIDLGPVEIEYRVNGKWQKQ